MFSERETVVELPFAADCCPCVEKLRTVLPFPVGIRDGVVHLASTLGSVVTSTRAELGGIITSALLVATVLTRQRVFCAGGGGAVGPAGGRQRDAARARAGNQLH